MEQFRALETLPPDEFMAGFVRLQLAHPVEPPSRPAGEPPPWMANRPGGLRAIIGAFDGGQLDIEALRTFDQPVYFALGGESTPDDYGRTTPPHRPTSPAASPKARAAASRPGCSSATSPATSTAYSTTRRRRS